MRGCECGICHHFSEAECLDKECRCCINFHLRSGPKSETHGGAAASYGESAKAVRDGLPDGERTAQGAAM